MNPRRKTLADRNREAIAQTTKPQPPAPEEPAARHEPTVQRTSTGACRVGTNISPAQYAEVKAAFLADWLDGGQLDKLSAWVESSMERHAQRTPQQRAAIGSTGPNGSITRTFDVACTARDRMLDAMSADQDAGRWLTQSAWIYEALTASVEAARTRRGGALPTPPARLPARLVR